MSDYSDYIFYNSNKHYKSSKKKVIAVCTIVHIVLEAEDVSSDEGELSVALSNRHGRLFLMKKKVRTLAAT